MFMKQATHVDLRHGPLRGKGRRAAAPAKPVLWSEAPADIRQRCEHLLLHNDNCSVAAEGNLQMLRSPLLLQLLGQQGVVNMMVHIMLS